MVKKLTQNEWHEKFIKNALIIHGNNYVYNKSICIDSTSKIIINCPNEGHGNFSKSYDKHITGKQGCPKCGRLRTAASHRMLQEEFIKRAQLIHSFKYFYQKTIYRGSDNYVIITCPISGHGDFQQLANNHINKNHARGCPVCQSVQTGNRCRKPFDLFLTQANFIHKDKYDYTEFIYINNKEKGVIICPEHGRFKLAADKHICRQQGCPKCAPSSYGEKFVIDFLTTRNYEFEKEYCLYLDESTSPKRVDFYIKSLNLFIEFNGRQHYEVVRFAGQLEEDAILNFAKQQIRDKELRNYCRNNNINLLEINITKCLYNKGGNIIILQKYIEQIIFSYIFQLKSKLYFTRNKVD